MAGLFAQDFPAAQGVWVEGFLTLLVELRRVFGNDMDKVMILSAIGQQLLRHPDMPLLSRATAEGAPLKQMPDRPTNIDALARATGIPRESVRRKVNELEADGLIARLETGGLTIAAGAAGRLSGSTEVTVRMLDQLLGTYLSMLAASGAFPAPPPTPTSTRGEPNGTP